MFHLIPTKAQWREWSLPSKLTCIGAYLGALSLAVTVIFSVWPALPKAQRANAELRMDSVQESVAATQTNGPPNTVVRKSSVVQSVADSHTNGPPNAAARKESAVSVRLLKIEANSIESLRTSEALRQLTQFESGKPLSAVPAGTYFFVQTHSLICRSDESLHAIQDRIETRRFLDPSLKAIYFEAHKVTPSEVYLLAYTTTETASHLATLDGNTIKSCIASPALNLTFDTLLYLPLFRVVESSARRIDFDDHTSGYVLELRLK